MHKKHFGKTKKQVEEERQVVMMMIMMMIRKWRWWWHTNDDDDDDDEDDGVLYEASAYKYSSNTQIARVNAVLLAYHLLI